MSKNNKDRFFQLESEIDFRIFLLIIFGFLGIYLGIYHFEAVINYMDQIKKIPDSSTESDFKGYLRILFTGFPVFFILWFFRTKDIKENINENIFSNALNLLENPETKRQAIIQLMYLRNDKKVFVKRVDLSTRGVDFQKVDLKNLNLRKADLREAQFKGANLKGTDLMGANLKGANLKGASIWPTTILRKAKYDHNTEFPPSFNFKDYYMILNDDMINRAEIKTTKEKWLKIYPKNLLTLRVIPLIICWCINKFLFKQSGYYDYFDIPSSWADYDQLVKKHFEPMIRTHFPKSQKNYEIKFNRDWKNLTIRWIDKNPNSQFSPPIAKPYEDIFKDQNIKVSKWITWIVPFGLWWNLRRKFNERAKSIMKNKGFSLIELLVTIGIIGLLVAIAIPSYNNYKEGVLLGVIKASNKQALEVFESCVALSDSASDCDSKPELESFGLQVDLQNTFDRYWIYGNPYIEEIMVVYEKDNSMYYWNSKDKVLHSSTGHTDWRNAKVTFTRLR